VDPATRTVSAHAEVKGGNPALLEGAMVEAEIHAEETETLALPEDGIVSKGGKHWGFVVKEEADGGLSFESRELSVGVVEDGWLEILDIPAKDASALWVHSGAFYVAGLFEGED
jgi:multidrug efflux pump subunit AcrA (membrane-fusion protein)